MRTELGPALQVGEELVWKGEDGGSTQERQEDKERGEGQGNLEQEMLKETEQEEEKKDKKKKRRRRRESVESTAADEGQDHQTEKSV